MRIKDNWWVWYVDDGDGDNVDDGDGDNVDDGDNDDDEDDEYANDESVHGYDGNRCIKDDNVIENRTNKYY